jgi:hypothetical protein
VVLPKNAPVVAKGGDSKTVISVRPASTQPRPAVTPPSGRQAMTISMSALY